MSAGGLARRSHAASQDTTAHPPWRAWPEPEHSRLRRRRSNRRWLQRDLRGALSAAGIGRRSSPSTRGHSAVSSTDLTSKRLAGDAAHRGVKRAISHEIQLTRSLQPPSLMRTTPVALLKESPARTCVAPTPLGCISATWQRDRHAREREAKAAVRDRSVAIGSPTNQCRRPDVNAPKRVFSGAAGPAGHGWPPRARSRRPVARVDIAKVLTTPS